MKSMDEFKADVYARADVEREKRADAKRKAKLAISGAMACLVVFAAIYTDRGVRVSSRKYDNPADGYGEKSCEVMDGTAEASALSTNEETEIAPDAGTYENTEAKGTIVLTTTTAATAIQTTAETAIQTIAAKTTTALPNETAQVSVTVVIGGSVKTAFVRADHTEDAKSAVEKNVDGGTVFLGESEDGEYAVATVERIDGAVSATLELSTEDGEDKVTVAYGLGECESEVSGWIIIFYREPGDHEVVTMFAN